MQCRWPIMALGSLAYCLPHSALNSLPSSQATRSLRLLVGAFPAACRCSSCLPIQLLAAFRLLACPFQLLAEIFLGCLPAPLAAYPAFSDCLPGRPAACLAVRLLAGPMRLLASPLRLLAPPPPAACRV